MEEENNSKKKKAINPKKQEVKDRKELSLKRRIQELERVATFLLQQFQKVSQNQALVFSILEKADLLKLEDDTNDKTEPKEQEV